MKVGIFVSAQIRGEVSRLKRNFNLLLDSFRNSEIVFGVWTYQKEEFDFFNEFSDKTLYVDEPVINYRPYIDNPNALMDYMYQKKLKKPDDRHQHQTKQILIHNELMKKYGKDYDVIVRSRYDTTVGLFINFNKFVYECYDDPSVISISTRKDYHSSILTIGELCSNDFPYMNHRNDTTNKVILRLTSKMLLDNGIIIHRSCDWNSQLVESLHADKKLLPAEFGWWQILVEGALHNNWKHYDGGASLSRSVPSKDRIILRKYDEMLCDND
jgi:hypothetical protein